MAGYLVLARKYRPKTFADVLGQGVVTDVLRGALKDGRIGQAYLFSGPRGTGKTTTARILARCLNCVRGPTAEPCGACEHCNGIDAGNDPDLIEIDAATHTGVDHVRELREQTAYAPMNARYKVYLVDEVHMLTKAAFNALLKTLEEPPPHVVFLFATTELHKVLATITSRCQVLKLKPLAESAIVDRLREVLRLEGVTPGPGLLEEIARTARGGMRDALSLADKLLALAGNEPTLDHLARLGGHTGARELEELCAALEAGNRRAVLEHAAGVEGSESELVAALLEHLRLSLVAAFCGPESPMLPPEPAAREAIVARAQRLKGDRVELWMQELLHARERMRLFPGQERMVLELTLLDLARPEATLPLAELEARLAAIEAAGPAPAPAPAAAPARPAPAAPVQPSPPRSAAAPAREAAPVPRSADAAGAQDDDDGWEPEPDPEPVATGGRRPAPAVASPDPRRLWADLVQRLAARHGARAEVLGARGALEVRGATAALRLTDAAPEERAMITDRRNLAAIRRALQEVAGRPLELTMDADTGAGTGSPAAAKPPRSAEDTFTNEVADLFGGVIEDLG
jgi:DNA polymerase-3 subunit gamma/tau